MNIDADGNIVMGISFGDIKHRKPYAYQKINGKTIPVDINFLETADQVFGFDIFRYNPDFDLTIDPLVELVYSTYLGGSVYSDVGYGIAVDQAGCAYVTGETFCSDFLVVNAFQPLGILYGHGSARMERESNSRFERICFCSAVADVSSNN